MRELTAVLVGLALACPLFSIPGTGFDSFRLPLMLGVAAALLGCAFLRASRGGDRPAGPAPLRTAGLLLLAAELGSGIGARSWAEAVPPVLTLSAGLAVFSSLKAGLLRRERAMPLLAVIPAVALLAGTLARVQHDLGLEAVSTEGNRNYAGALAAMLLPPVVALAAVSKGWRVWLGAIGGGSAVYLLLASEARGGFLAALAGLFLVGGFLWSRKTPRSAFVAIALLAVVAGFVGSQWGRGLSPKRMETATFRLETWKSGLRMLAKRPVLGWGAGNFGVEYPPFRSETEFRISHADVVDGFKEVEDPHSTWVAAAVETGALGFLSLLLVLYVAARLWGYYARRAADPETTAAVAGLGGGALAYLVAGAFNTLSLHASHTVLFWTFLGLLEVIGDPRPWKPGSRAREIRAALPAAGAIVLVFGAVWTWRMGVSERRLVEGMTSSDPGIREARLREAIEEYPQNWHARYELARTLSAEKRDAGAAEQARETLRLRPHHVDALNQAAISTLKSGGDVREAEGFFRQAIDLAPYYYKSYYNLAQLEDQQGQAAEAVRLLSQAIIRKPDHGPSWGYRGLIEYREGFMDSALRDFRTAQSLGFPVRAVLRADPKASADPALSEFF